MVYSPDQPIVSTLIEGEDDDEQYLIDIRRAIASRQEAKAVSSSECMKIAPDSVFAEEDLSEIPGVVYKKQIAKNDCGQTVLEMVGITNHGVLDRNQQVSTSDIFRLGEQVLKFDQNIEGYDTFNPNSNDVHVVLNSYVGHVNHWVVEAGGKVFDPARGIYDRQQYAETFGSRPLAIYTRPIQSVSAPL